MTRPASSALEGSPRRRQLWRIVDGAVADALHAHPDYVTAKGARQARTAIVKRVVGAVMGYAAEGGQQGSAG